MAVGILFLSIVVKARDKENTKEYTVNLFYIFMWKHC